MKLPPLVLVEWVDSQSQCSQVWGDLDEMIEDGKTIYSDPCMSVGYLVHKNTKVITLVPHLASKTNFKENQGSGDMTIPRCAIIKMKKLK